MKKIIIGSDHAGFSLKSELVIFLKKKGFSVKDIGTYSLESCDYPLIAYNLAKEISQAKFKRGILICKTGIGNTIVANKLIGVRAALCYNIKAARLSRQHNDANVLVLGAEFVKSALAKRIVWTWLITPFVGGRHLRRIRQIKRIERGLK
ncbi:MAG: ribose 5-phosphate isomerase B [Candidatus Omnitrophica bacterium]|nr:ribose 5-phosphate isomerase B [Candidatus Omnitrophota bacterium]